MFTKICLITKHLLHSSVYSHFILKIASRFLKTIYKENITHIYQSLEYFLCFAYRFLITYQVIGQMLHVSINVSWYNLEADLNNGFLKIWLGFNHLLWNFLYLYGNINVHHCWRASHFNRYSTCMAINGCLACNRPCYTWYSFDCHLLGPVTLTPVTECLTVLLLPPHALYLDRFVHHLRQSHKIWYAFVKEQRRSCQTKIQGESNILTLKLKVKVIL